MKAMKTFTVLRLGVFTSVIPFTSFTVSGQNAVRVTAVSNARVRVEPSVEVRVLATLPLGTDLVELGRNPARDWVRVRTQDGTEGWMLESLTRPIAPERRLAVLDGIIRHRLGMHGAGFDAWAQLVDLTERVRKEPLDAEASARHALHRLQAIRGGANAASMRRPPPAVAAWIAKYEGELVHHDMAAMWILKREVILAEHARHRGTRAAPELAWLAVTNGLPGECEGDLTCYVERGILLEGEYLRQYPSGAFTGMAVRNLLEQALSWRAIQDEWKIFTSADCAALKTPLARLRTIVGEVQPAKGDAGRRMLLLQTLDDVWRRCGDAWETPQILAR